MSKPFDRLTLLETFVRIAETGSISAAARQLGLSQPSASRQLAELEKRLGSQLIRRSTHALTLTDSGRGLLVDARCLMDSWEMLTEKYGAGDETVQGHLKLVVPVALTQEHLAGFTTRFQEQHPRLIVNLQLEDGAIRFAETGCDCWIKVGAIPDENLVVRTLGTIPRALYASPNYLQDQGQPKTPEHINDLELLALSPYEGEQIPLSKNTGNPTLVRPPVKMKTNNIYAIRQAVLDGLGIAVLPHWLVHSQVQSKTLQPVLPDWQAPSLPIQVGYLPSANQPKRLQLFLSALREFVPTIPGIQT